MSAAAGTVAQLAHVTGIPESTIRLYARDGDLDRVDRVLVGRRWVPRYDGAQLMRVSAARTATRRNRRRVGLTPVID